MPNRAGLLILLGAAIGCGSRSSALLQGTGYPFASDMPRGLEEFVGNSPQNGTKAEALALRYERLTGEKLETNNPGLEVWLIAPFESDTTGWLVVQVDPGEAIPGISSVVAHVFDRGWKRLSKEHFPTGYRSFITDASVIWSKELGQDLLVIKTTPSSLDALIDRANPPTSRRYHRVEYFAFVQGRLELIRMEDDHHQVERNSYTLRTPLDGPAPPTLSSAEWKGRLSSERPSEQMAALVWLTGHHLSYAARSPESQNCEPLEDSLHYEAVRDSPRTHELLEQLKGIENPWIREYAGLGFTPPAR